MIVIGYIQRAIDGDTLQVILEDETEWQRFGTKAYASKWREECRVRLRYIDAAELRAKDSTERERAVRAHQFTKAWLDGLPNVLVEYDELKPYDSFGRVLAVVFKADIGESLNDALRNSGNAVEFTRGLGGEMEILQPVVW